MKKLIYFYNADIAAINEPRLREGGEVRLDGYNSCYVLTGNGGISIIVYVKSSLSFSILDSAAKAKCSAYLQISFKYLRKTVVFTAYYNHPSAKLDF